MRRPEGDRQATTSVRQDAGHDGCIPRGRGSEPEGLSEAATSHALETGITISVLDRGRARSSEELRALRTSSTLNVFLIGPERWKAGSARRGGIPLPESGKDCAQISALFDRQEGVPHA